LIGMARLSTPNDKPELLKVFDRIVLKQTGRGVEIGANFPAEVIETIGGAFGIRKAD
jgi:predicted GNAT family N-acyltransferase